MKYTTLLCLLAALIISLSLTGCSRDPKPTEQDSEPEVALELGEDNSEKEENTKPSLAICSVRRLNASCMQSSPA